MTTPEALCSTNVHVEVDGLRFQVTGRGATPAEAIANVRGQIAALQSPPPGEAPQSVETRLGVLMAKGLACAARRGTPGLVERIAAAAWLVLSGKVHLDETASVTKVDSQTHEGQWYEVTKSGCSCKGFLYASIRAQADSGPTATCKHTLAVALAQRLA